MKPDIHPDYQPRHDYLRLWRWCVETRSTKSSFTIDICSKLSSVLHRPAEDARHCRTRGAFPEEVRQASEEGRSLIRRVFPDPRATRLCFPPTSWMRLPPGMRSWKRKLCRQEVLADASRYTTLSRERADLADVVAAYGEYRDVVRRLDEDREALHDPELRALVEEEIPQLEAELEALVARIQLLLLPKDPKRRKEHPARDSQRHRWRGRPRSSLRTFSACTRATLKPSVGRSKSCRPARLLREGSKRSSQWSQETRVYSKLRFEGGVHRVQRVPATESTGSHSHFDCYRSPSYLKRKKVDVAHSRRGP